MLCILLSLSVRYGTLIDTPQYDPTDYGTSIHAGRIYISVRGIERCVGIERPLVFGVLASMAFLSCDSDGLIEWGSNIRC